MPVISMFYGIIIRMFFYDNKEHKLPHIHVEYGESAAVISIPSGDLITGRFPGEKLKLVLKYIKMN